MYNFRCYFYIFVRADECLLYVVIFLFPFFFFNDSKSIHIATANFIVYSQLRYTRCFFFVYFSTHSVFRQLVGCLVALGYFLRLMFRVFRMSSYLMCITNLTYGKDLVSICLLSLLFGIYFYFFFSQFEAQAHIQCFLFLFLFRTKE